jgi:hypothetical protein
LSNWVFIDGLADLDKSIAEMAALTQGYKWNTHSSIYWLIRVIP